MLLDASAHAVRPHAAVLRALSRLKQQSPEPPLVRSTRSYAGARCRARSRPDHAIRPIGGDRASLPQPALACLGSSLGEGWSTPFAGSLQPFPRLHSGHFLPCVSLSQFSLIHNTDTDTEAEILTIRQFCENGRSPSCSRSWTQSCYRTDRFASVASAPPPPLLLPR